MNGKAKSISSISAICLALQAALNLGFSFLVGQLGVDKKSDFYYVCISALAVIVNIIPALILLRATKKHRDDVARYVVSRIKTSEKVLSTVGTAALVFAVGLIYGRIFPDAAAYIPVTTDTPVLRHIMLVVSLCILPAICEEFFFREALARSLSISGKTAAVIVSALAFGLAHFSAAMFPYAFFAGLMFGYLLFKTGDVKYTVAAHFFCNFTSYLFALAKAAVPKSTYSTLELVTMISFATAAVLIFCINTKKSASKADDGEEKADAISIITPAMAIYLAVSVVIIFVLRG